MPTPPRRSGGAGGMGPRRGCLPPGSELDHGSAGMLALAIQNGLYFPFDLALPFQPFIFLWLGLPPPLPKRMGRK